MQRDIDFIKQRIDEAGQCKTLAITNDAAVGIFGTNGYAWSGNVPQGMKDVIFEARNYELSIDDIVLKDNGGWLVTYNNYRDFQGEYIPKDLCVAFDYCIPFPLVLFNNLEE